MKIIMRTEADVCMCEYCDFNVSICNNQPPLSEGKHVPAGCVILNILDPGAQTFSLEMDTRFS